MEMLLTVHEVAGRSVYTGPCGLATARQVTVCKYDAVSLDGVPLAFSSTLTATAVHASAFALLAFPCPQHRLYETCLASDVCVQKEDGQERKIAWLRLQASSKPRRHRMKWHRATAWPQQYIHHRRFEDNKMRQKDTNESTVTGLEIISKLIFWPVLREGNGPVRRRKRLP